MAKDHKGHGSQPRITDAQRRFIDALFANPAASMSDVTKAAGIPERTGYYAISRPQVKAEIERRIREQMGTKSFVRAAIVAHDLLGAESEYVRADISKHVLSINGVKPQTDVAAVSQGGISLTIVMGSGQAVKVGSDGARDVHGERVEPENGGNAGVREVEHTLVEGADEGEGS